MCSFSFFSGIFVFCPPDAKWEERLWNMKIKKREVKSAGGKERLTVHRRTHGAVIL